VLDEFLVFPGKQKIQGDRTVSTTLMTEPAAGWYHDPADAGAMRWWDGATWTDHVQPMGEPPVSTGPVQYEPVPTHAPVFEQIAPVAAPELVAAPEPLAPAPVAAPTQVGPATIPQPGQVAPAPAAAPAGGVPMTPTTPVSDQLYWHSSAAEVIDVPRLAQQTHGRGIGPNSTSRAPSFVRDWNDLGSPHTAGIWLLALWPVIGTVVALGLQVAMNFAGVTGLIPAIAGSVASLLLGWVFAAMDVRALGERGFHKPRLAWMLLFPPLAYLIARGKTVRRESKLAWPPELVFILSFLLMGAAAVAVSIFAAALALSVLPAGTTF
jgi:hypothetical protein